MPVAGRATECFRGVPQGYGAATMFELGLLERPAHHHEPVFCLAHGSKARRVWTLKRSPDDPDIHFGLARALENDGDRATAALAKALELNPRHVESLLLQADNLIDREEYKSAEGLLEKEGACRAPILYRFLHSRAPWQVPDPSTGRARCGRCHPWPLVVPFCMAELPLAG